MMNKIDQITFLFFKYPFYHGYKHISRSLKILFFQIFLFQLTNLQLSIQLFLLNTLSNIFIVSDKSQFKLLYFTLNRYIKLSPIKGFTLSILIFFYLLYGYWSSAFSTLVILIFDSIVSCKLFPNFFVSVFEISSLSIYLFIASFALKSIGWLISVIVPWSVYIVQLFNLLACYYLFSSTILVLTVLERMRNNVVFMVKMIRNKRILRCDTKQLFEQIMNSNILLSKFVICNHVIDERIEKCELCTLPSNDTNIFDSVHESKIPPSSGHPEIDRIISNSQLKPRFMFSHIEWIPFERFENVTNIAENRFGYVRSAWWIDGPMCFYENGRVCGGQLVVIKNLGRDSSELTPEFLNKLETYINISTSQTNLRYELLTQFQCYGLTRDPHTNQYCLVMDFAKNGDLRKYLDENYENINWISDRLQILGNIAKGLKLIHEEGLVHGDIHTGNILIGDDRIACITDLIQLNNDSKNDSKKSKGVYGVLPFVAPEVLQSNSSPPYVSSSDIYSFGIIMWILSSGKPPMSKLEFTTALAVDICDGERPNIVEGTPQCFIELMQRCWDSDPTKRPTTKEICEKVFMWYFLVEDHEQFQNSDNNERNDENHNVFVDEKKYRSQFIDLEAISVVERFEELDEELWGAKPYNL
ncbi:hypothetical protein Glove_146g40 [Diversispora epigaea]|uniref:Protein kinase domain-containing protein n=1 Tax=Diversispora epigaea TaxID=1348612 RepID=A0A397J2T2_9GLOM|nr:hypothetical protein Glove_146g40 [Diversispora epigaea]